MKKNLFSLMLIATIVTGMVAVLWAAVPPPPVNQLLGLYDSDMTTISGSAGCLTSGCHQGQNLVKRHHDHIATGTPCLDCHSFEGKELEDFRTCSVCHNTDSPHHDTTDADSYAAKQDCKHCHGSVVDNPGDHYMPTYASSSVTPQPKGELKNGVYVQGCQTCHMPSTTAIDPNTNSVRAILSNRFSHHNTGLYAQNKCSWCHVVEGINTSSTMRTCERCHGVKSLHAIQWKANNATPVPGAEAYGYGHIGNNDDCMGCHYGASASSAAGISNAMVPCIKQLSDYTVMVDQEKLITIHGLTFVNIGSNGVTYNPTVSITKGNISYSITPISYTDSEIQFFFPALQEGSYEVRVVKDDGNMQSNLVKVLVVPELSIKTATLSSSKTVTISGTGFRDAPPTDHNYGLGVYVGTTQAKLLSWSDSKIVAYSSAIKAGVEVTVKTLYGPVSKYITPAAAKAGR